MTEKQLLNKDIETEVLNNYSNNPIECIIDPNNNSPVTLDTDIGPEIFRQIALLTVPEKTLESNNTQENSTESINDNMGNSEISDKIITTKNETNIPNTERRKNSASVFFHNCISKIFGSAAPNDKKRNDSFFSKILSTSALEISETNQKKVNVSTVLETELNADPNSGEKCRIFAILKSESGTELCNSLYIFEITESDDRISLINIVDEQLFSLVLMEYFKCVENSKHKFRS